ncbi:C-C motif chemokine 15-like isoform 2-T4 [Glossophaga mutica]
MKLSAAALPFLILAAALGPPAHAFLWSGSPSYVGYPPGDCCLSYLLYKFECTNMKNYYVTSSECHQPGVIFKTKQLDEICADPREDEVLDCMRKLASAHKG